MQESRKFLCHLCGYRAKIKGNLTLHLRNTHKLKIRTKSHKLVKLDADGVEIATIDEQSLKSGTADLETSDIAVQLGLGSGHVIQDPTQLPAEQTIKFTTKSMVSLLQLATNSIQTKVEDNMRANIEDNVVTIAEKAEPGIIARASYIAGVQESQHLSGIMNQGTSAAHEAAGAVRADFTQDVTRISVAHPQQSTMPHPHQSVVTSHPQQPTMPHPQQPTMPHPQQSVTPQPQQSVTPQPTNTPHSEHSATPHLNQSSAQIPDSKDVPLHSAISIPNPPSLPVSSSSSTLLQPISGGLTGLTLQPALSGAVSLQPPLTLAYLPTGVGNIKHDETGRQIAPQLDPAREDVIRAAALGQMASDQHYQDTLWPYAAQLLMLGEGHNPNMSQGAHQGIP